MMITGHVDLVTLEPVSCDFCSHFRALHKFQINFTPDWSVEAKRSSHYGENEMSGDDTELNSPGRSQHTLPASQPAQRPCHAG